MTLNGYCFSPIGCTLIGWTINFGSLLHSLHSLNFVALEIIFAVSSMPPNNNGQVSHIASVSVLSFDRSTHEWAQCCVEKMNRKLAVKYLLLLFILFAHYSLIHILFNPRQHIPVYRRSIFEQNSKIFQYQTEWVFFFFVVPSNQYTTIPELN